MRLQTKTNESFARVREAAKRKQNDTLNTGQKKDFIRIRCIEQYTKQIDGRQILGVYVASCSLSPRFPHDTHADTFALKVVGKSGKFLTSIKHSWTDGLALLILQQEMSIINIRNAKSK